MRDGAVQQHMPRRREGHTTAVTLGGERFYITANARTDATLGEVFIQWGKQGTSCAGLVDVLAIAWSVALQHGVPLTDLVRHSLDLYFVPTGRTDAELSAPPAAEDDTLRAFRWALATGLGPPSQPPDQTRIPAAHA